VIAALGHSLIKTDAVAATCTTAGNPDYWTCSVCGKYFADSETVTELTASQIVIAALGHSLTKTNAVAATCITAGNPDYWTCSACGKYFVDDAGTTELAAGQIVIAALGHSLTKTDAVAATCATAGNPDYWTCSECGKYFVDDAGTTELTASQIVIAALGHSLTKTDAVAATCTTAGNPDYWTCSVCGKYFADSEAVTELTTSQIVIAALGHTWSAWTETTAPTETEEGTEMRTCSICGETETRTIPAKQKQESYIVAEQFGAWVGNGAATAMINADHTKFVRLLLNGNTVDASDYTVTAGSTVITLKESYLMTLGNGTHSFFAEFNDGISGTITLTVNKTSSSDSGGLSGGAIAGIIIGIIAALAIAGFCVYWFVIRKKKQTQN
ncbi:MAG: hypothetical protein FWD58_07645, partial [Firmicutes bacterium]|nr:hypothetical protein [Bacillota bacterium]